MRHRTRTGVPDHGASSAAGSPSPGIEPNEPQCLDDPSGLEGYVEVFEAVSPHRRWGVIAHRELHLSNLDYYSRVSTCGELEPQEM